MLKFIVYSGRGESVAEQLIKANAGSLLNKYHRDEIKQAALGNGEVHLRNYMNSQFYGTVSFIWCLNSPWGILYSTLSLNSQREI